MLQNLITSKFIAHFLGEVSAWQKKLMMADAVITVWFEVQRTWTHLESIFMSSEDIRKQLPVDSDRFDKIDHDFKILMEEMVKRSSFSSVFFISEPFRPSTRTSSKQRTATVSANDSRNCNSNSCSARKLLQNTSRQNVCSFPASTSSVLLICWTSSALETNRGLL